MIAPLFFAFSYFFSRKRRIIKINLYICLLFDNNWKLQFIIMETPYIYDSIFLDLFSGSGGIGIEALSRGAKEAYFVEKAKPALRCIRENLRYTKLDKKAQVLATDVNSAIRQLETKNVTFDHIFMDPPYKKGFEEEVLSIIDRSSICTEDTVVIVESSLDTEIPDFEKLKVIRVKEYKTNKHTFLMKTVED